MTLITKLLTRLRKRFKQTAQQKQPLGDEKISNSGVQKETSTPRKLNEILRKFYAKVKYNDSTVNNTTLVGYCCLFLALVVKIGPKVNNMPSKSHVFPFLYSSKLMGKKQYLKI